jgi:diguanylate cyclase (GGDEF)-like protein
MKSSISIMPRTKPKNQDLKQRYTSLIEILPDMNQSDPLRALKNILEAREWALEQNDTESIARFYQFEGNCLYFLSRPVEALKVTYQALDLFEKLEMYPSIIACQIELGLSYMSLGDFPDGIEWLELALNNSKKHNRPIGIFTSLSNIRDAEMKLGNFEQALKYGEQSLILAKELNSDYRIANEQAELGITHIKLGQKNFESAPKESMERFKMGLDLLRQARETSEQNPSYGFEVDILNAQAVALAELGQIEDAFEASNLALEAAKHNDNPSTTADSEKTRGWLYFKTGQTAKSLTHYEKALEIYSAIGKKDEIANTHRELAKVCKESHQFAEALEHLEKFYELDAQLRSEAAERRAQALAAKLDLEKARHDAEMHRVRSEELVALNSQLRNQAVLLEKLAREDELTGLANRRKLEEFAIQAFAESRVNNSTLCMAIADLDFFKGVNDRFGHATGDSVMRVLGAILREHCPEGALAARFGGEEFVLILPYTKAEDAFVLCENIRIGLQNYNWKQLHPNLAVTISLGLSDSHEASTHERLLSLADLRLYEAKNAGRNCTRPLQQQQLQTSNL